MDIMRDLHDVEMHHPGASCQGPALYTCHATSCWMFSQFDGEVHPSPAIAWHQLSALLYELGKVAEATEASRTSLQLLRTIGLQEDDPTFEVVSSSLKVLEAKLGSSS